MQRHCQTTGSASYHKRGLSDFIPGDDPYNHLDGGARYLFAMKKTNLMIKTGMALLALPTFALAQDKADPGKASDAVKNPTSGITPGRPAQGSALEDRNPGKSSDGVAETNPANAERRFSGKIVAVNRDQNAIVVNDASLGTHELKIDESTKLTRNDKSATWADLKLGETVTGLCRGTASSAHAESIQVGK